MKMIALPDLHSQTKAIHSITSDLSSVDLILLVGDLTNNGKTEWDDAAQVIETIRHYNQQILAVPGNWDGPQVSAYLSQEGINLHGRCATIQGITFIGIGGALPSFGATPNEISETSYRVQLANIAGDLDLYSPKILISHQPPINTLNDKAWGDIHLGSYAIREFIEKVQPLICFTGHIHEGIGIDTIGTSQLINPGPLWQGCYAFAEIDPDGQTRLEIRQSKT
jgi:Icc-related predicted phosphoesterase